MHSLVIHYELFAIPLGIGYRSSIMKVDDPGFTWLQFEEAVSQLVFLGHVWFDGQYAKPITDQKQSIGFNQSVLVSE